MKSPEPSTLVLRDLERIDRRRAQVWAVVPADHREAAVRRLLLDTLDEMEEELCARGRRSPVVREGWRRLARFESFTVRGAAGAVRGAGDGGDGGATR